MKESGPVGATPELAAHPASAIGKTTANNLMFMSPRRQDYPLERHQGKAALVGVPSRHRARANHHRAVTLPQGSKPAAMGGRDGLSPVLCAANKKPPKGGSSIQT
jgi:hypothetical protein